ncbi:uncharacterized protein LOC143850322 [Tasmannia lanceolata]|uniref:uncharacterized protein LOC143850322 n=1 Tax=Tasmannia lanceolata TaxID=3420 RepID=UPI004062A702
MPYSFIAWQALLNRLSTRDRLYFLDRNSDLKCPLCRVVPESVDHLFFNCSFSSWIWRTIIWKCGYRRRPHKTLLKEEEWIRCNFKGDGQASTLIKVGFCSAIYMIWCERNNRLHGKPPRHKQFILQTILSAIRGRMLHLHLNDIRNPRNIKTAESFGLACIQKDQIAQLCSWECPKANWSKLNSDAALVNDKAGLGGIIRNWHGDTLALYSIRADVEDIHLLEMKAIYYGIKLAAAKGCHNLWIESDSLLSVNVILHLWQTPWKAIPIIHNIRQILSTFTEWHISHIWREANAGADFLSKPDCYCEGDDIPIHLIPQELKVITSLDATGTSYPRL